MRRVALVREGDLQPLLVAVVGKEGTVLLGGELIDDSELGGDGGFGGDGGDVGLELGELRAHGHHDIQLFLGG